MPDETPASAADGVQEATGALEALPEGSDAKKKVKYYQPKQAAAFIFQPTDALKVPFQVTSKQAGSEDLACRIAELCYAKFESGASKAQVTTYRDELIQKCAGASAKQPPKEAPAPAPAPSPKRQQRPAEGAPAAKKQRAAGGGESLLEALEREGRLEGALRIEGRLATKKNHEAINGVFALLPDRFEGRNAYEKVVMGSSGLQGCKRFLYFAASGKKWKISDALGDGKGGYCFLKAKDGGEKPPLGGAGGSAKWSVFDGKAEGYKIDAAVRSSLVASSAASAGKAAAGAADAAESSCSSSSSSSEDEAPGADPASQATQPSQNSQHSQRTANRTSATAAVALRPMEPAEPSRVCAKAAVLSGLRCACHYCYAYDCPNL